MPKQSNKKIDSILMDLAIAYTDGDLLERPRIRNSLDIGIGTRNSHVYRSDIPLIDDFKTYNKLLLNLTTTLQKQLNKMQFLAVMLYFSHAKVSVALVSKELDYNSSSITNAISRARLIAEDRLTSSY